MRINPGKEIIVDLTKRYLRGDAKLKCFCELNNVAMEVFKENVHYKKLQGDKRTSKKLR